MTPPITRESSAPSAISKQTSNALIASGKLDATDLKGKWESFVITTVSQPVPGIEQALVIAGSDKRGSQSFAFTASADQPWVRLSATSGTVDQDQRLSVDIDWKKIPTGQQTAVITIARADSESVKIQVSAIRSDTFTRENVTAFGGLTGPTAIAAESAVKNIPARGVRWERIPDYGRARSGLSVFPTTAASVRPPADSPHLEYPVFIAKAGAVHVDLITGSSLNVQPDRGLRVAVSFDGQAPQIIDAFANQSYADPSKRGDPSSPPIKDWANWVRDNIKTLKSKHTITEPGVHTLKVWMVDPGMVLEKLVVHDGKLPKSYFGPPEVSLDRRDIKHSGQID